MKDQIFDIYDLIGREHVLLSVGTLASASETVDKLDELAKFAATHSFDKYERAEEMIEHPEEIFKLLRGVFKRLHDIRTELDETVNYETKLQKYFIEKENPILEDEHYGLICSGESPKGRLELKVVLSGSSAMEDAKNTHKSLL